MSESNGDLKGRDPNTGQFKEGHTYAKGRKVGSKNWHTTFDEALKVMADSTGKTPEELELALQQIGIKKALGGDHRFWLSRS